MIELGAVSDETSKLLRTFLNEYPDGMRRTQPGARHHGVLVVRLRGVGQIDNGGDATLGPRGGPGVECRLGKQHDRPSAGGRERHHDAGHPGPDDHDVDGLFPGGGGSEQPPGNGEPRSRRAEAHSPPREG